MRVSIIFIGLGLVMGLVGCLGLGPEFMAHYDKGTQAATDEDYETCVSELEAAIKIKPSRSSITYHRLAFCYGKVGRPQDSWWAIRQAVIINPLNGERREGFRLNWEARRDFLVLGVTSLNEVLERLGTPDTKMVVSDSATGTVSKVLLGYGLVSLKFEPDVLVEIAE